MFYQVNRGNKVPSFFLDMAFVGRYSVKIAESIYFLSSHLGSVGLKKRQGLGLKKEKLHVGSH